MRPIDCIHSEAAHAGTIDAWKCASCGLVVTGEETACVKRKDETDKKAAARAMRIVAGSEIKH